MNRLLVIGVLFLLISSIGVSISGNDTEQSNTTFNGKTLYVGGTGSNNYSKIQDAIDNASDGDTVFVYDNSSPYIENIIVDKSINLLGEDRDTTVIDGNRDDNVVNISTDQVNISGFTIRNSSSYYSSAGIDIRSNYNTITNNKISNNYSYGIYLYSSNYNIISGNNLTKSRDGLYLKRACKNTINSNNFLDSRRGISIGYKSNNNIISNNSFFKNGLWIWDSYQNNVRNNTINGKPLVYLENELDSIINVDSGQLIIVNCSNITIQNQEISNTFVGIELWATDSCLIYDNTFSSNIFAGVLLLYSNNNTITDNLVSNNYYGLNFGYSSNNIIIGNTICSNNGWSGIYFTYSNQNNIIGNNITKK